MPSHMRQPGSESESQGQFQQPAAPKQPASPQPPTAPQPQGSVPDPVEIPYASDLHTPSPSETAPKRFKLPDDKPKRRWPAVLLLIAIIVCGVAFVWLFVMPGVTGGSVQIPFVSGGEGQEGAAGQAGGEQTGSVTESNGSPVELQGVSDDGVALRFSPDGSAAFLTVHIVGCEVNGESHDPSNADDPIRYTVVNESTGETVQTIDPYFITSGEASDENGTVVVVKVEGLTADQYDSVTLTIDETFAQGDLASGDYTTEDVNGLTVQVTKTA